MGKSIWGCAPKAVRVGVCVSILALVFSEILHREPQSVALLIQLYDPLFPLYAPWAEDKALYVLRAAMLVPVGALLWRYAKHPLAWSEGILALALALEIVQVAFRLYYLRLYAVLACAAGLLLALPLARRDTSLHVRGAVSTPYLDMTLDTAARFGIEISQRDYEEFYIPGRQRYRSTYFSIEGDWSAAAMLLVAGATAGEVTVRNVSMLSKQADTAICTALVRAGAAVINEEDSVTALHRPLRAFEFDATNCPDLFPALAALAAAADGVSVIRGTSRLEYKECNRSEAIREEYAKLGIEVDTSEEDLMKIRGGKVRAARTQSHGDHRMAMSLAVAALRSDEAVEIEGAESVAKSYPGFFEDLEHIRV